MSERDFSKMNDDEVLRALVGAAKEDRPKDGAHARAVAAVLPELSVAVAREVPRARPAPMSVRALSLLAATIASLLFVAVVGGGLFIKHQHDVAEAQAAAQAAELAAQKAETARLMAELWAQTENIAAMQASVQNAKDEATRAAALAQLEEAKQVMEATSSRIRAHTSSTAGGGARPTSAARPACNCTPGDPLCSCIP
jgi:uncharacterized protein HemX